MEIFEKGLQEVIPEVFDEGRRGEDILEEIPCAKAQRCRKITMFSGGRGSICLEHRMQRQSGGIEKGEMRDIT